MRVQHYLIATFLFLTGLMAGQKRDSIVLDIKAKYKNIRDSITALQTATIDLSADRGSDGIATSYSKGSNLRLIVVTYYGESGKSIMEYYFNRNNLFFAHEKKYTYNRPVYWDKKTAKENSDTVTFDETKSTIEEDRYYFQNKNLILWLDNNKKSGDLTLGTNSLIGSGLIAHAHLIRDKFIK